MAIVKNNNEWYGFDDSKFKRVSKIVNERAV